MIQRIAAAVAALALAGTSTAAAAQQGAAPLPCIGAKEAEGLVLVMAPELLRSVGTLCAASLPPTSLLRQPGAFLGKYQAASDGAWDEAKGAIARLTGPEAAGIMDSEFARPLLGSLLAPMLLKDVTARDCVALDRVLSALAPLPPRNTARLIVTLVQLNQDKRAAQGKKPDLPLCPLSATQP